MLNLCKIIDSNQRRHRHTTVSLLDFSYFVTSSLVPKHIWFRNVRIVVLFLHFEET